jgi:uncharacterized MAPEG superfamily protein
MTIDLWMLVASTVLCLLIPFVSLTGLTLTPGGTVWGFGNRDTPLEVALWVARARRAHANMVENLAPFAVLVLVAHVAGKANATTALGAELFLIARIAHLIVYTVGIPVLRTIVFSVGTLGEVMILLQLFR